MKKSSIFLYVVVFVIAMACQLCVAQQTGEQVANLIERFQKTVQEGQTPSVFLSPNTRDADAQLQLFQGKFDSFSVKFDASEIEPTEPERATVPATILWRRGESNLERHTKLKFERVNGQWYFNDFRFMRFPWVLFTSIALAGFAVGIAILFIYLRFRKRSSTVAA